MSGVKWAESTENPWGVPVLDIRSVTLTMLSMSENPRCAKNVVSYHGDDGTGFLLHSPAVPRKIETNVRFRRDRLLADGALFVPEAMEHKWAIYFHKGRILFVRSWLRTGTSLPRSNSLGKRCASLLCKAHLRTQRKRQNSWSRSAFCSRLPSGASPGPITLRSTSSSTTSIQVTSSRAFGRSCATSFGEDDTGRNRVLNAVATTVVELGHQIEGRRNLSPPNSRLTGRTLDRRRFVRDRGRTSVAGPPRRSASTESIRSLRVA
jgi:hypothetical protein